MKAQCEKCKEIVPLRFRTADGGIRVSCPDCSSEYFVAGETDVKPKLPVGDMECAKCGEMQPKASACRGCGLRPEHWNEERAKEVAGSQEEQALWTACEADWESDAPHDELIAYCQRSGLYSFAAARYRGAARTRSDGAAKARLARVQALAELALLKTATPVAEDEQSPYKGTFVVLAFIVVLAAGGLIYALMTGDDDPASTTKGVRRPVPSLSSPSQR